MAYLSKVSVFLRRLGMTFLLTALMVCVLATFCPEVVGILWLPCWIALFVAFPYLDRKLNLTVFKARKPRQKRPTAWGRIVVTGLVAFGISIGIDLMPVPDVLTLAGPLTWIASYYGWPALSRRLSIPESWKAKAEPDDTLPARGSWRLLGRGALATLCVFMALLFPGMMIMGPIGHSMMRARRVHDSVHVGMTLPEVLGTCKGCDLFAAGSEFPYDQNDTGDDIPAICRTRDRDGLYRVHDVAAHRDIALSEAQEVERLRRRLHDGYRWRFSYTYLNITPMHVSFSVIFGPDGRVSEVSPVHGWD